METRLATLARRAPSMGRDLLRLALLAALLVVAGGLALPGHRGLFGALGLLLVLAGWLLPDGSPPLHGPSVPFVREPIPAPVRPRSRATRAGRPLEH